MDHIDPGIAQERDASLESWMHSERSVDERQHDDRYAKTDGFSEDAHRKVVTDAVSPFVNRVAGAAATMMASVLGSDRPPSVFPGLRSLRMECPVCSSGSLMSRKSRAAGWR